MDKNEARNIIGKKIDISKTRLKADETESLLNLTSNIDKYDGKSKTHKNSHIGWSSDGKYERKETTTHTIKNSDAGISIIEEYNYYDDDGQKGGHTIEHTSGRDILGILASIFPDI